jgi:hypothetical protein
MSVVEIILVISRCDSGRLTGTARLDPGGERTAFSGTLELIAVLERLLDQSAEGDRP